MPIPAEDQHSVVVEVAAVGVPGAGFLPDDEAVGLVVHYLPVEDVLAGVLLSDEFQGFEHGFGNWGEVALGERGRLVGELSEKLALPLHELFLLVLFNDPLHSVVGVRLPRFVVATEKGEFVGVLG